MTELLSSSYVLLEVVTQRIFQDNVTGGYIRLIGHGRAVKSGTPGSRFPALHLAIMYILLNIKIFMLQASDLATLASVSPQVIGYGFHN